MKCLFLFSKLLLSMRKQLYDKNRSVRAVSSVGLHILYVTMSNYDVRI